MKKIEISIKEKIERVLQETGFSRSQLARELEVDYQTVYRWLDQGVLPHKAQARRIDELFKEQVDLSVIVNQLRKKITRPIKLLKQNIELGGNSFS